MDQETTDICYTKISQELRTAETAVGKKRTRKKEAEEDREMIKKLATDGSAVRNERQKAVLTKTRS